METVIVSSSTSAPAPAAPTALKTDQTHCPFCDKVTYWSGRNKHIFSAKHLEEHVKPMLLKQDKYQLMAYRKASKTSSCPLLFCGKEESKPLYLCFGCKKAKEYLPTDHLRECPHAEAHITELKKLVGQPEDTDSAEGDVDAEVVLKLKKEIDSLKRQLKVAKKELEDAYEAHEDEGNNYDKLSSIFHKVFNVYQPDEYQTEMILKSAKESTIWRYDPDS